MFSDPKAKEPMELRLSSLKEQYLRSHGAGEEFSSHRDAGVGDADGDSALGLSFSGLLFAVGMMH